METRGLLFIPDISGFTRFVNETEIDHSRLIIQELLELLINTNQIGLDVSEVEGDAILFYKFGESPGLEELYKQVEKMFCEFHRHLVVYEQRRYCQCKACKSAIGLSLKIVTHYGEFTGYNVKTFNKLIGKDVIVAHQLLKNNIDEHEYWLVTKNLLKVNSPSGLAEWMQWNSSSQQTGSGEIAFHYTQLGELKKSIQPAPLPPVELADKARVISISKDYDSDIITMFHAVGDFSCRIRWMEGLKAVEEVNHYLPRVGMRCRYIMESGETIIYSSSYSYQDDVIEFSETDENKKSCTYIRLEKTGDKKTKLTLDFYIKKNIVAETLFKLTKKNKMEASLQISLVNLEKVAQEIKLPEQVEEP